MKYDFGNILNTIDTVEYEPIAFKTSGVNATQIDNSPMPFLNSKLVFATARATMGSSLKKDKLFNFEIEGAHQNLNGILQHSNSFKYRKERLNRFRDFSKTARIGEIGQGLSFLYAQEELGYKAVLDFNIFLERSNHHIDYGKKRTPDYVMCDDQYGGVSLLENKSTSNSAPKHIESKLNDAKKQCESGAKIITKSLGLRIDNLYATCTVLENSQSENNSTIHVVDPEGENSPSKSLNDLIRLHYSYWLDVIGDSKNASVLRSEGVIEFDSQEKFQFTLKGGVQEEFIRLRMDDYWSLDVAFALPVSVLNIITTQDSTNRFNKLLFELDSELNYEEKEGIMAPTLFRDGFLIFDWRMLSD